MVDKEKKPNIKITYEEPTGLQSASGKNNHRIVQRTKASRRKKEIHINVKNIVKAIGKELSTLDESNENRAKMIYLIGFLEGLDNPPQKAIQKNIAVAVQMCRDIELKYAKTPSDKLN